MSFKIAFSHQPTEHLLKLFAFPHVSEITMSFAHKVHEAQGFVSTHFGYDVSNLGLLYEAIDTSGLTGRQSNKRLALVGDGALGIAMVAAWYPSGADRGYHHDLAISGQL
ncbi:unnamed protein product [Cercospora beticola]|nr:unnamed protein product [Cercospora beticola]